MRYILPLILAFSLYGAGFWTLSGLSKLNVYVQNKVSYLEPKTLKTIRAKLEQKIKFNGIKINQQDSATLMLSIKEIVDDETHYIHMKLAVGEEVQTFREDKTATFAITYETSKFFDVDITELDSEILENLEYLLAEFTEQYQDDNE